MPSNIFTAGPSFPGYAGYFGPTKGGRSLIGFGTNVSEAQDAANQMLSDWGFLCESYTAQFSRNVASKHFLNVPQPAAMTGYPNGTLQVTGMVGTYDAFENIINHSTGDLCGRLVCVITNGSSFTPCADVNNKGTQIICAGLIVDTIQITGQVDQQGVLIQQAIIRFNMSDMQIEAADPISV